MVYFCFARGEQHKMMADTKTMQDPKTLIKTMAEQHKTMAEAEIKTTPLTNGGSTIVNPTILRAFPSDGLIPMDLPAELKGLKLMKVGDGHSNLSYYQGDWNRHVIHGGAKQLMPPVAKIYEPTDSNTMSCVYRFGGNNGGEGEAKYLLGLTVQFPSDAICKEWAEWLSKLQDDDGLMLYKVSKEGRTFCALFVPRGIAECWEVYINIAGYAVLIQRVPIRIKTQQRVDGSWTAVVGNTD